MELTQQQIDTARWILDFVLRACVLLRNRRPSNTNSIEQSAQVAKANAERMAALQARRAFWLGVGVTAMVIFAVLILVNGSRQMRLAA